MKTVLFAINDLNFGGGQRTLVSEANLLSERGYAVFVLTLLPTRDEASLQPLLKISAERIVRIPFSSFLSIGALVRLVRFLWKTKPDVIVSNLFFTNTFIRLAKLFYWPPKILVREGNVPTEKSLKVGLIDCMLSLLTRVCIVNAAALEKLLHFSYRFSKFKVVYNGIGKEFLEASPVGARENVRKELGLLPDEFALVVVGSLTEKKGHTFLLDAFAAFRKNGRIPTRLFIVGEGPLLVSLQEQARSMGIAESVVFTGGKSRVLPFLYAADVFVLPSLWEGMPNALLEAMAVGVPVVSTPVGGVAEVVKDYENGMLVPAGDFEALRRVLNELFRDPRLRSRLGAKARESVSGMTWERHADELVALIEGFTRETF